ncbi:single-stranded DNA-binding protein [bacterium]|nr:single-stranded DNA-binding protein [bacterium]
MFNLVVLIGNLGSDPEIRTTPSGIKVAKMSLAVNDNWTNRQTGEREQKTHWIDLNAWDRLAQTAERYLTRGQRICVRGSLEYREWQTQDGHKRNKLEVRVREMFMLSPKDQGGGRDQSAGGYQSDRNNYQPARGQNEQQSADNFNAPQSQERQEMPYTNINSNQPPPLEDDDIPF